nr:nitrate reductase gamma subunit [uncultured bacterium]
MLLLNVFWDTLLFEYLPYASLAVLFFGIVTRFVFFNKSIQATSTQLIDNSMSLKVGSFLWHYGIVFVLLGHIFGLLTPMWMYDWFMTPAFKRMLAISLGSTFGLMALCGLMILTVRRFCNPNVSANSTFQDKYILLWLMVQIILGLSSTACSAVGSLANYLDFDSWAQGLVTFKPDAWEYIAGVKLVYKLHIVNGFLIFFAFPYSKLVHFLVFPAQFLWRKGQQIVWKRDTFNE